MICPCPAAESLPKIPKQICPEDFGQIQKIAFQRIKNSRGPVPVGKNGFDASPESQDIHLLASWSTQMSAGDDAKIVISPFIEAPTQEGGDPRTFGGGNETLGGVEIIMGSNPSNFTCVVRRAPQCVIAAMKQLMCEAANHNLAVYLFSEFGTIEALAVNEDGTLNTDCKREDEVKFWRPIPIQSLFIGDKIHGGFEQPDFNSIQFSFAPNYSDALKIITPRDFNPLDL